MNLAESIVTSSEYRLSKSVLNSSNKNLKFVQQVLTKLDELSNAS